jgi:hypothetical protein
VKWLIFAIIVGHGLIHFMGFARSFGLAELPQLTQPIPRSIGALWLVGGLLLLAAAALVVWAPGVWWIAGLGAALLSQAVIALFWHDARFGTVVNALILVAAVYSAASPGSR